MTMLVVLTITTAGPSSVTPRQAALVGDIVPAADTVPLASGTAGGAALAPTESTRAVNLTPASVGVSATPSPPSLADQPPLRPHEVFGFAPYWSLGQSGDFDLHGLTTVAYFSLGINPDGSLADSGPGWQGYQSQQFLDLIDRAHAAGDRVVLTVNDFSQSSLDQLTSKPAAAVRLGQALVTAVEAKSLDGVNLDLEGEGSEDQAGLTALVGVVSGALHRANPDYQVTMDTYASSAGDPSGFYNIAGLSPLVDGFFVMAYQLNSSATSGSGSPLTSAMFSNQIAAQQYAAVAPPSKVILGLPFFGYDWPTTNGTLSGASQGAPSIITSGQELASGHPVYWDPVTNTAWTSYQSGSQWHEAFFENPYSLYLAAKLAQSMNLGGVGIWALGMDGSSDQAMVSALDGSAPAQKDALAGPTHTTTSPPPAAAISPNVVTPTPPAVTATRVPVAPTVTATRVPAAPSPTSGTTAPVSRDYSFAGTWLGAAVSLIPGALGSGQRNQVGTLSSFATNDASFSCLESDLTLRVYSFTGDPAHFYLVTTKGKDCAGGVFLFGATPLPSTTTTTHPPTSTSPSTTTTSTTSTTTTTSTTLTTDPVAS